MRLGWRFLIHLRLCGLDVAGCETCAYQVALLISDQGQAYYEERYRQCVEINFRRMAEMLGMRLVPMEAA